MRAKQDFKAYLEEQILRTSKEITVKFIEIGRISPASFPEHFKIIYASVSKTVKASEYNQDN